MPLDSDSSPPPAPPMSIKQRMAALAGAGLDTGGGAPVPAAKRAPPSRLVGLEGMNGFKSSGLKSPSLSSGSAPPNPYDTGFIPSVVSSSSQPPSPHLPSSPSLTPDDIPAHPALKSSKYIAHSHSASLPPPRHHSPPPPSALHHPQQPPPKPYKPAILSSLMSPVVGSMPFTSSIPETNEEPNAHPPTAEFDKNSFGHQFPSITEFESASEFGVPSLPQVPLQAPEVPSKNQGPDLLDFRSEGGKQTSSLSNGFPVLPEVPNTQPTKTSRPLPSPPGNAASLSNLYKPSSTASLPALGRAGGGLSSNSSSVVDIQGLGSMPAPPPANLTSSPLLGSAPILQHSPSPLNAHSTSPTIPWETLPKPDYPFANTIFPSLLRQYLTKTSATVLLLDVRPPSEHRQSCIPSPLPVPRLPETANIDPQWLNPQVSSSHQLAGFLPVDSAFHQREKFELVVIYDRVGGRKDAKEGAVSRLAELIYDREFGGRSLRRAPVVLLGGWEAWEKECRLPPGGAGLKPLIPRFVLDQLGSKHLPFC